MNLVQGSVNVMLREASHYGALLSIGLLSVAMALPSVYYGKSRSGFECFFLGTLMAFIGPTNSNEATSQTRFSQVSTLCNSSAGVLLLLVLAKSSRFPATFGISLVLGVGLTFLLTHSYYGLEAKFAGYFAWLLGLLIALLSGCLYSFTLVCERPG
jgi:hypothetical protein